MSDTGKTQLNKKQLCQRVWQFMGSNKPREAVAACQQLQQRYPNYGEGWYVSSHLWLKLGHSSEALGYVLKSLELEPQNPAYTLQKARCLKRLDQVEQARDLALTLADGEMPSAFLYSSLGDFFAELGMYDKAETSYQHASKREPKNSHHIYNLATVQRFLGKATEAEVSCNKVIALNPDDYEVYMLRSDLRRQTQENNHIQEMENFLQERADKWQSRVQVLSALAKEHEDIDEHDTSFRYVQQSNELRRRHMKYDVGPDVETMEKIREVFSAVRMSGNPSGNVTNEPFFILGLPRTGTTLAERIIDSHTDVHSAGELNNFAQQLMILATQKTSGKQLSRVQLVQLSGELDFTALGKNYLDSTRPATGTTPHFIDKLPLNFLYTGLIHLALHNAKIIHLHRHPMDACFAIYKRLFRDAYPFSYNLEELGRYYIAYQQLMAHWHQVMPGVIYDLHYEQLVAEPEAESRKLIDYLGLPWQEQCLEFHKSKSVSTTASASQVREKVYTSSVGKWRMYEKQLQPLQAVLEQNGICCD